MDFEVKISEVEDQEGANAIFAALDAVFRERLCGKYEVFSHRRTEPEEPARKFATIAELNEYIRVTARRSVIALEALGIGNHTTLLALWRDLSVTGVTENLDEELSNKLEELSGVCDKINEAYDAAASLRSNLEDELDRLDKLLRSMPRKVARR